MHATYWFRVLIPRGETDDEVKATALEALSEYAERHGDENNWFQEEMLLLPSGRVIQLAPADEWRGRSDLADHFIKVPAERRWREALHSAACRVAFEVHLRGADGFWFTEVPAAERSVMDMTYDELLVAIPVETARALAQKYTELAAGTFKDEPPGLGHYIRRKQAQALELFVAAEHRPFADHLATPYDYPCYDLAALEANDEVESEVALLAVDIHT